MASYLDLNYSSWREDLERYRIDVLDESEVLSIARQPNILPVTSCSLGKGFKGTPSQLYTGVHNVRFYKWCDFNELKYGVLSDLYGLVLWDEVKDLYDVHPSKLDKQGFRKLASKIGFKMESIDCDKFLFFGLPPVSCRPYFYMMIITGFKIFYTTKLPKE